MVEQRGRSYYCAQCGARLNIDESARVSVVIHAASGEDNERVLTVHGRELHRCRRSDKPSES